jgi:hypothetical protein
MDETNKDNKLIMARGDCPIELPNVQVSDTTEAQ